MSSPISTAVSVGSSIFGGGEGEGGEGPGILEALSEFFIRASIFTVGAAMIIIGIIALTMTKDNIAKAATIAAKV